MSKRTGRYSEQPASAERPPATTIPMGSPPLAPLATQPMAPLEGATIPEGGGQTLRPENAAVVFGPSTPVATTAMVAQPKPVLVPAGPPPEIGLTQHTLPDDDPDPRLALMIDPDSERSAAFRVLRHHLLEIGRPQCVVVSSAKPREGKTTTAINLALALAECGRAKVLLVETYVRRPQLADVFRFTPSWCFAEQLAAHRHQPSMPWSVTEIPRLWLHVAAINPKIEKTQLLDGPAFAIAIERLRLGGYDHIIVDAPPILGSADVNLIADAADAVVLTIRARKSTTRELRKAVDQIGANRLAGTVLLET